MMKISKITDYAVVALTAMVDGNDQPISAASLSEKTKLPEPTIAKVLKLLAKSGLINSVRGANGGYTMVGTIEDISIADVIVAIEGPVAITSCVDENDQTCDFSTHCTINGRWTAVNNAIKETLDEISLADMVQLKPFKNKQVAENIEEEQSYGRI